MIRVMIADDHPIVRQGLKQIVAAGADIVVEAEAANAHEVLELARARHLDAVVLDINLPGTSGMEVLKELKRDFPRLPVLILSAYPEDQFGIRALRAGAAGYMTKETAPDGLINAIRQIVRGRKYVSQSLAQILAVSVETAAERPLHTTLSDREYDVMRLIASGKTVTQIADELRLSAKTISTYRTRILEKMKMGSNAELARYAVRNGLID